MFGFGFFSLAIAIVAFVIARKALNQVAALRTRLEAMEASGLQAQGGPLTPLQELERSLAASSPAGEPASTIAAAEPAGPVAEDRTAAPAAAAATPPLPQPTPGFEERIGTRWVVWVGGLTLALGGFFMVKYSIDQGLLGPRTRVTLGGLFALVL